MKLLRLAAIAIFVATAACAPRLETLPVADFHAYKPDLTGIAEPATLRGSYEQEPGFLGTVNHAVGVFAINGKVLFEDSRFDAPIQLVPGKQSLTIGYITGGLGDTIPVMLDAKPGGRYVIKRSQDTNWADGLRYNRIRTWLYIEDERTGEIVVPKTPDLIRTIEGRYQPPHGANVATIRGTGAASVLSGFSAFPVAIDGQIVREGKEANILLAARWDPTQPVALEPGIRAIAIFARGGMGDRYLPILLDVQPGAAYVVKSEHTLKRAGGTRVFTYTIWIEDAATGDIVVPKADLPGGIYPTL